MNDDFSTNSNQTHETKVMRSVSYIETPRVAGRPERIDALLEKRMRDFLLARRQHAWRCGEMK